MNYIRLLTAGFLLALAGCGGGGGDAAPDSPRQQAVNNSAPTITGTLILAVTQDQPYAFVPTVFDADGDDLVFSILSKPAWADFDRGTGALAGVPGNDDVGTYDGVVISVSDGLSTASLPTFSISVINVNDSPAIAGSPSTYVEVGKYYRFVPDTTDPDGLATIIHSIRNKPDWAAFDPLTGALSGAPRASDVGTVEGIVISVDDGEYVEALPPFSLTVTDFRSVDWVADRPIVPLLGTLSFQDEINHVISTEELEEIAKYYVGVWGNANLIPKAPELDYLRSLAPDFFAIPYLNSSQANMRVAETDPLNMINFYLEGSLNFAITAESVELSLRVADTRRGWGLKASTVAGEASVDSSRFVTFVRVGEELMRIEQIDANAGSITVTRGFAGTTADAHTAGENVFAPVYVAFDGILNNGLRLLTIPDNEFGLDLRYSLQVGQPEIASYLADEVLRHFEKGRDGAWLDICSPAFFHPGNAFGETVVPWNFESGAEFTPQERKEHQERKLHRLQSAVASASGRVPVLTANNLAGGKYFEEGGGAMDYIFVTGIKSTPINGAVLEGPFSEGFKETFRPYDSWATNLSTLIHGAQNGAPVLPWVKTTIQTYRPNAAVADRFELFDFSTILLGWEFGSGASVPLPIFASAPEGGRRLNLAPWLFYDIGEPAERAPYDAIEQLRVPGKSSFMRRWSRGVVLVNPTETDDEGIALPGTYLDPVTREQLSTVDMPAQTGRILILD